MIAILSADIVQSTSLQTKDLIDLRNKLLVFFADLGEEYPGFWGRIVRGDSIECYVPEPRFALRIAILVKLFIKMTAERYDCSELLQKYGIRFSIGMGEIKYVNRGEDIIDGPAIYLSGRNLDFISRKDDVYSIIEVLDAPQSVNCFLDSFIAMLSNIVDSYSAKKAEVVYYKLLGFKEREISERLGIFQSSVNTRSTNAQWRLLNTAINDFEHLKFERICG
jgi:hypothetical protein